MVVTTSLKHISFDELLPIFNEAFSDYDVPVSMTLETLQSHLQSLSYSSEDSVGLFEKHQLAGFLLIGRRGSIAYDAGTGIIPSYRGRGLSHTLIDAAIAHLRLRGCTTFVLEVLDSNTKAKNLYQSHGFAVQRSLFCYSGKRSSIPAQAKLSLQGHQEGYTVQPCFEPSYQNSLASVIEGGYTYGDLVDEDRRIGTIWYHPNRGSIAQINIEPSFRNRETLKQAIVIVSNHCTSETMRLINADEGDKLLHAALEELGFTLFATQSEMVLGLSEKA